MRPRELAGETGRLLRARPVQTVLVASLAAAMVVAVLMTVGRAVVLEQSVLARTETPEGRTIVITDTGPGQLIQIQIVRALARLEPVERVVALTTPVDAVNLHLGAGSAPIPVWGLSGDVLDVAELRSGRQPRPGEALISDTAGSAVGIAGPVGALLLPDGRELPIVGTYEARPPFDEMDAGAVWRLPEQPESLRQMRIVATSVRQIEPIIAAAVSLFDQAFADDLQIERAAALAELQRVLAGDVSRFGRQLVVGVLVAGMVLVALVVFAEVLTRRKDLGRQRALGARRSTVITLLAARTAVAASLGSAVGLVAGLAYLVASTGELPRPSFAAGLVILAILAPALASTVPAWWAAQRDPALELRTP